MSVSSAANKWEVFSRDCVCIETAIDIDRPPLQVFDYVTTPALWHTWHPATVEVRDVPNRPLGTGETMLELIAVGGRRNQALWTVLVCTPAQRWEIATETDQGSAHITYQITASPLGCRFHRKLAFRSARWPWRALDSTLMRWVLERQSSKALRNLKAVLELGQVKP